MGSSVTLQYVEDYTHEEVFEKLQQGIKEVINLEKVIKPNMKVAIKCNLSNNYQPDLAMTTHPEIISSIAEIIAKYGANCVIFDNPSTLNYSLSKIFETTGMLDASNNGNAELTTNDQINVVTHDGRMAKSFLISNEIMSCDLIINVSKLLATKTGLNGSLNNLFSIVPTEEQIILKSRLNTQEKMNTYLFDLFDIVKDKLVLNIVDGIVARESNDCQRIMNCLICSDSPVLADFMSLQIISKDYASNNEITLAKSFNLFDDKFKSFGESVEKFKKPDFCFTSNAEELSNKKQLSLINSMQKRPIIHKKECKGCKRCIENCPSNAIYEESNEYNEIVAKIDYLKCINCYRCVEDCPYKAISTSTPYKNKTLTDKLTKRIIKE